MCVCMCIKPHILPEGVCSCRGTKTERGINWDLCGLKRLQSKSSHKCPVSCREKGMIVTRGSRGDYTSESLLLPRSMRNGLLRCL